MNVSFEFSLPVDDAARLWRVPALAVRRSGRVRSTKLDIVWNDTATGILAQSGLALAEEGASWRLERLAPVRGSSWTPAISPKVLAVAPTRDSLGVELPGGLVPVAAFTGRRRELTLSGEQQASVRSIEGTIRGVMRDRAVCRVILDGPIADMAALATSLGEQIGLSVAPATLAAEAIALAASDLAPARRFGAPQVAGNSTVDEALTGIVADLADAIFYWGARVRIVAQEGASANDATRHEPVHQMRVAMRRLRSALSMFRKVDEAGLGELAGRLKAVASDLGTARDWDVFLSGTGASVVSAFPGDRRIASLMAAATRRQAAAYKALGAVLSTREWQRLEIALAVLPALRPWSNPADEAPNVLLTTSAHDFAALRLGRRLKRVLAPGEDLSELAGSALHDVRKQAKRLRYTGEFFAPLFGRKPVRRYLRRLAVLQEALGTVNDTVVAADLLAQLGGGADRAFASGVVQGFIAADSMKAAAEVADAWTKFIVQEPFWT